MSSAAPRLPFLDSLRGYAILGVIAVHVELVAPLSSLARTYAEHGRYGVQLFFVVSAVSIGMAWHARRDGYLRFLTRRLFRLLPALAVAAIAYTAFGITRPAWWQAVMTLTLTNGLHPSAIDSTVPGSWSLSAELMFYLSVPVLAASVRSMRSAAVWIIGAELIGLAAAPVVTAFWDAVNPGGVGGVNAVYYGISIFANAKWFILGWTVYLLMRGSRLSRGASNALFCLGIAALAAAPFIPSWTLHELAFMFGIPAVVYAMAGGAAAMLDNPVMRWLGTISYSMYLWHFVVWNAADWLGRPSFLPLFAGTVALTALGASLTYVLIERPGIRLGAALLRGLSARSRPQPDPTASDLGTPQPCTASLDSPAG
jgi:peptidoglycan/LPS O-acetylase OafA/YrhL